jgi:uncharacterized SAM-binding protein YcdF (DUF218 family)
MSFELTTHYSQLTTHNSLLNMHSLLSNLLSPILIFWILLIVSSLLFLLKRRRVSKILLFISLLWLLMISSRFVPNLLVQHLEKQYSVFTAKSISKASPPYHIIVLGAGYSDDPSLSPVDKLVPKELGRLVEGIRIYRMIPGCRLVTSGAAVNTKLSQAEVVADAAVSLGVDSGDIIKLTTTINTRDEARSFCSAAGTAGTVIVVTDAVHMPRAMMLFKKAGLSPIAAPTNHLLKKGSRKDRFLFCPSENNISKLRAVMHEYAGLVWERVRGGG